MATNFLFAHQTNVLADEAKAAVLRHNSFELLMGIHVNKHFPWLPDLLESLPLSFSRPMMPPGLIDMLELFDVSSIPVRRCVRYNSDLEGSRRANQYYESQIIKHCARSSFRPHR